jgi:hypothetical protein
MLNVRSASSGNQSMPKSGRRTKSIIIDPTGTSYAAALAAQQRKARAERFVMRSCTHVQHAKKVKGDQNTRRPIWIEVDVTRNIRWCA